MLKNQMQKRIRDYSTLTGTVEYSDKRAKNNNNDFNRFIKNCIHELTHGAETNCFTKEQAEHIISLYGDNNLYYIIEDNYYIIKPKRFVVCLINNKEKILPITSVVHLGGEVIKYVNIV